MLVMNARGPFLGMNDGGPLLVIAMNGDGVERRLMLITMATHADGDDGDDEC